MRIFNRLISSIVLVCFVVNAAVQDYAFALATKPLSTQPEKFGQVYAAGQKLLATKEQGPASGISDAMTNYSPGDFAGEVPDPEGLKFVRADYSLGLPEGWEHNALLNGEVLKGDDSLNIVKALEWFREHEARLGGEQLEIVMGDFELENNSRGEIPICRIERDTESFRYRLVIHKDFASMWADIKKNDVWFSYTFPDGKTRTVSLAWAIFYRIAKHEMSDLVSRGSKAFTPKSKGHMEYTIPFAEWSDTLSVNRDEREANNIKGRYAIINDGLWMWFLGSYCLPGHATKYSDRMFEDRARWFLGMYQDPANPEQAKKWNDWAIEHKFPEEFPNLVRDEEARETAIWIARAVNKNFYMNYEKYEIPFLAEKEAEMARNLAEREKHLSEDMMYATGDVGRGRDVPLEGAVKDAALKLYASLAGKNEDLVLQARDSYEIIVFKIGGGIVHYGIIRNLESGSLIIGIIVDDNGDRSFHKTSGIEDPIAGVQPALVEYVAHITPETWVEAISTPSDDGRFKAHPGKSPEDMLTLIGMYIEPGDVITAPVLYDLYKTHYKELGFESPAKRESALRTIERDLFESDSSIFKKGIIRELPEKAANGERQFVEIMPGERAAKARTEEKGDTRMEPGQVGEKRISDLVENIRDYITQSESMRVYASERAGEARSSIVETLSQILNMSGTDSSVLERPLTVGAFTETKQGELRAGLTPDIVRMLTKLGIKVIIQRGMGMGAGFSDAEYVNALAHLVDTREEVLDQADIIQHIKELQPDEITMVASANKRARIENRPDKIIWNFNHFANCLKDMAEKGQAVPERLLANAATGASFVSFENVWTAAEGYPILKGASQKAGVVGAYEMARYMLELDKKTSIVGAMPIKEMLLSYNRNNKPEPTDAVKNILNLKGKKVSIYGGGTVGYNEARILALLGADVAVIEKNPSRRQYLKDVFTQEGLEVLIVSSDDPAAVENTLKEYRDGTSTTAYTHGAKAQKLISKEMVERLGPGRVYVVVDIDQGGGIEGVRETSHMKPIYVENGCVFYCVPNIPARVPRQTSTDISLTAAKYLTAMALYGLARAAKILPELGAAVDITDGHIVSPIIRNQFPKAIPQAYLADLEGIEYLRSVALDHEMPKLRIMAAAAVIDYGPVADRDAMAQIIAGLVNSTDMEIAVDARTALLDRKIDEKAQIKALGDIVDTVHPPQRVAGLASILKYAKRNNDEVTLGAIRERLDKFLVDEIVAESLKVKALKALCDESSRGSEAAEALTKIAVEDKSSIVRAEARIALLELGIDKDTQVAELKKSLPEHSTDQGTSVAIEKAILLYSPAAADRKSAHAALIAIAESGAPVYQIRASAALAESALLSSRETKTVPEIKKPALILAAPAEDALLKVMNELSRLERLVRERRGEVDRAQRNLNEVSTPKTGRSLKTTYDRGRVNSAEQALIAAKRMFDRAQRDRDAVSEELRRLRAKEVEAVVKAENDPLSPAKSIPASAASAESLADKRARRAEDRGEMDGPADADETVVDGTRNKALLKLLGTTIKLSGFDTAPFRRSRNRDFYDEIAELVRQFEAGRLGVLDLEHLIEERKFEYFAPAVVTIPAMGYMSVHIVLYKHNNSLVPVVFARSWDKDGRMVVSSVTDGIEDLAAFVLKNGVMTPSTKGLWEKMLGRAHDMTPTEPGQRDAATQRDLFRQLKKACRNYPVFEISSIADSKIVGEGGVLIERNIGGDIKSTLRIRIFRNSVSISQIWDTDNHIDIHIPYTGTISVSTDQDLPALAVGRSFFDELNKAKDIPGNHNGDIEFAIRIFAEDPAEKTEESTVTARIAPAIVREFIRSGVPGFEKLAIMLADMFEDMYWADSLTGEELEFPDDPEAGKTSKRASDVIKELQDEVRVIMDTIRKERADDFISYLYRVESHLFEELRDMGLVSDEDFVPLTEPSEEGTSWGEEPKGDGTGFDTSKKQLRKDLGLDEADLSAEISKLIGDLQNPEENVPAFVRLIEIGRPAAPAVINLFKTSDKPTVKSDCLSMLGRMRNVSDVVEPFILEYIQSDDYRKDYGVRMVAIEVLGNVGTIRGRDVLKGLLTGTKDEHDAKLINKAIDSIENAYKSIPIVIDEYGAPIAKEHGPGILTPSSTEIASFYQAINMLETERVEVYIPKDINDVLTRSVTEEIKNMNKVIRERIAKSTGRTQTEDPIDIIPYNRSNLKTLLERKGPGVRRIFVNDLMMTPEFRDIAKNDIKGFKGKRVITMSVPKGRDVIESTVHQAWLLKVSILSALLDENNILTVGRSLKDELEGRIADDPSKFVSNLIERDDASSREILERINYFLSTVVKLSTFIGEQLRILKAFWIAA